MFTCIAKTEPDWGTLLPSAQAALGRSVTASLDERRLPLAGAASFLVALAELNEPGLDALVALRSKPLMRKHVNFCFFVNLPRAEFFALSSLGLSVTAADVGDFAVVSARLGEWVSAVVEGMQASKLRRFFCLMHSWFETENLGECWSEWEKEHLGDGMYRLVRKAC